MTRKKTAVLLVLIVFTVLFIFSNSLREREESTEQSKSVLEVIADAVEAVIDVRIDREDDHWLRKTAHFCEFAVLGLELALLALLRRRGDFQSLCNCLFAGLLVAVTDEALQLISDRGSQIQDVLLDFSGVLAAVLLVYFVKSIMRRKEKTQ